jgi:hypothetical protein
MATLAKRLANNAPAERMRRTINDLVTQINGGGPLQVSALGVGIAPPAAGITSADRLWVIKSQSALFTSLFSNTDTTHGTASSEVEILTGGASGGDPILHLSTGVLDAAIGLDNSDSDALVIAYNSATPGTNNVVRIDATTLDVLSGSFKVSASTVEAHKVLLADIVAAAALRAHVVVQRSGTTHGSLGLDASDRLVLMDSTPAVAATVYTVGSTAMLLARVPCVRLTASGTVCGSASTVQLQMDASVYDNDSMYDSANKRIVIQHAGKYGLAGSAYYPGNAAGTLRWTRMYLNGATVLTQETDSNPAGTFGAPDVYHSLATDANLAVGDFITIVAYQDTGGNQTVAGNCTASFVSV